MYVLSAQLEKDVDATRRYAEYLKENQSKFPVAAYDLATGLLLSVDGPHDGWLEWAKFEEPSEGDRHQIRSLSLSIRLLGSYHDKYFEFFYPHVFSYAMNNARSAAGHSDWRYSEIRLNSDGNVIHEIEWAGPPGSEAHWIIEATNVQMKIIPLDYPKL